ncbi:hypothetical protein ARMSODRAFT_1026182 [Armillaria solidipes]|uniref:Secreted protein n=1 Tax=Armillaria solidipes TaxID=1076256 RepID=A0A2H3AQ36_9AGAR|nr:hypothetical protein ARMSODRAFT_1026182 [Armillaria solidipes]
MYPTATCVKLVFGLGLGLTAGITEATLHTAVLDICPFEPATLDWTLSGSSPSHMLMRAINSRRCKSPLETTAPLWSGAFCGILNVRVIGKIT